MKFIDKCIKGFAHVTQIDDYIDQWHKSDSQESLFDFLGMSYNDYINWISDPKSLELMIEEKKFKKT